MAQGVILFLCLGFLLLFSWQAPAQSATEQQPLPKSQQTTRKNNARPPRAHSWNFDKSDHSQEIKRWKQGLGSDDLKSRATTTKQTKQIVNSSIEEAMKGADKEGSKKNGLARTFSVREENTSFRDVNTAGRAGVYPGENPVRSGRHIVGAFADVQQGEDLHILVGPELSIKNELGAEKSAGNQPESALGMGMRFKLDF